MISDRVLGSNGFLHTDAAKGHLEIAPQNAVREAKIEGLSVRPFCHFQRAGFFDRGGDPVLDYASRWSLSLAKRGFDVLCVTPALVLLSPIALLISGMVRVTSEGPVFFRQQRMGKGGQPFTIYKFRTMVHRASRLGPGVTKADDPRLTRLGRFLRKHKLDEIPQLYNVLRGDMSLVGPRPKLPEFEHSRMECRPGITGAATLAFATEEKMLVDIPVEELDHFHIEVLSPMKRELDVRYQREATFRSDLGLLIRTLFKRYPSVPFDRKAGPMRFGKESPAADCGQELSVMPGRPSA